VRSAAIEFKCPACLSDDLVGLRLIKSQYADDDYTLYQCNMCHSRSFDINEQPETNLSDYYNVRSEDQDYLSADFKLSDYWSNEVEIINGVYDGNPQSVLDVGCRTGDFLLHWPKELLRCGVELSIHSAAIGVERGLDIRQGSLENIEFLHGFDIVSGFAILEHLEEPRRFLDTLVNLVNHNGILVIMIPSYQTRIAWILDKLHGHWHMYSPPEHLLLYSREYLDTYLDAKQFTLASRRYTSGGIFNPFRDIPLVQRAFGKIMWLLDTRSPLSRWPVFDHMYSYYIKS